MRLVTSGAAIEFEVCIPHMALRALRDKAVDGMTGGTVKGAVPALMLRQLGNLLSVTGKTDAFFGQRHIQRRMRVTVAAEAVFRFEVDFFPLTVMAFAALLDRLLYLRWMADMATCTRDAFMPSSGSLDVIYRTGMTLLTLFFLKRFRFRRRGARKSRKQHDPCDEN